MKGAEEFVTQARKKKLMLGYIVWFFGSGLNQKLSDHPPVLLPLSNNSCHILYMM